MQSTLGRIPIGIFQKLQKNDILHRFLHAWMLKKHKKRRFPANPWPKWWFLLENWYIWKNSFYFRRNSCESFSIWLQIPKILQFKNGESRRLFMEVLFRFGGKGDSVQELIDKKSRGHANGGRLIFRNKPEFIFMQLTARLDADAAGSR